ncbi:MAG: hypothetical protein AB7G80_02795 [Dongiaceae bacterium]
MKSDSFQPKRPEDMPGKSQRFIDNMFYTAYDFWHGVKPSLETQFGMEIMQIENMQEKKLIRLLDQKGIDAFYLSKNGKLESLASRANYKRFSNEPAFSLRYALWDEKNSEWDYNREYQRKLDAVKNAKDSGLFPHIHVEFFCFKRGSANIKWAYMIKTADLVRYIEANIKDKNKVLFFNPEDGREEREVVYTPINILSQHCKVDVIKSIAG